jgi:gamma-glutamylputrescine oxidase
MSLSLWNHSQLSTLPPRTEILILGGGFVGLSAAYWITTLSPGKSVVILERDQMGAGASGKNAGFLTKGSHTFYQNLAKKFSPEFGARVFDYIDESLHLLREHVLQDDHELASRAQSRTYSLEERPGIGNFTWSREASAFQGSFKGSWLAQGELRVHPMKLLRKLRELLESRGVKILESVEAFDLGTDRVETNRGPILFDQVLLALNAYSPRFHAPFRDLIAPKRAQMLSVKLRHKISLTDLCYDPAERVYWRMTDPEHLIIGGKRLMDEVEENSDFEKINPKVQRALEDYLRSQLGLTFDVHHRWAGIMGFTQTELPMIQTSFHPGCFVAAGFSGHGMGMGFHAAREISQMILGQRTQSILNQV